MAIVDEIFNKKNGGQFFSGKKDQTWGGGGSEGSLVKDHTFAAFFFVHPSLMIKKHQNHGIGLTGAQDSVGVPRFTSHHLSVRYHRSQALSSHSK